MGKFTVTLSNRNITVEMGSTLLLLALAGMAAAHPQMRQHITTVSMSNLEASVSSGRTAHIKRALHQVGAIAVDGLSADYVRALEPIRTAAPACLEGSLRVKLNDAVERFSHVQSNGEEAPKCVKADYDAVISTFDKVENEITGVLANILGNSTLLVKEGSQIKEVSELETKTHHTTPH